MWSVWVLWVGMGAPVVRVVGRGVYVTGVPPCADSSLGLKGAWVVGEALQVNSTLLHLDLQGTQGVGRRVRHGVADAHGEGCTMREGGRQMVSRGTVGRHGPLWCRWWGEEVYVTGVPLCR